MVVLWGLVLEGNGPAASCGCVAVAEMQAAVAPTEGHFMPLPGGRTCRAAPSLAPKAAGGGKP
jgi:hypothetical protein